MQVISRSEALILGLNIYYTGKPCRHGHDSYRYAKEGKCSDCVKIKASAHKEANKARYKANEKKYYADNQGRLKEKARVYREQNPEKVSACKKRCYQKNKPPPKPPAPKAATRRQTRKELNKYFCERRKRDPAFKISAYMRNMLRRVLVRSGHQKIGKTTDLLGYGAKDLIRSIESKFLSGMSWENYGEWHIDHKRPLSVMIKEGETRPAILNALSNLQPLWAADNISKGAKESPN